MSPRVYLDHHASAPLGAEARAAMVEAMGGDAGNPSSLHREGRRARDLLERARVDVARAIGAREREVVFTSGGTEAVHLGVRGLGEVGEVSRVLCDPGAHPCLRAACEALARRRGVALDWIRCGAGVPDYAGEYPLDGALVAIAWVQHETGRVAEGAEGLIARARGRGAKVVVDAVQALGKVPLDVRALGAAAVALSSHKIGGPQGIGALWVAPGERVAPRLTGGGQERGLRAGTENLLCAAGFGAAARSVPARLAAMPAVAARRARIERALLDLGADASCEGPRVATVSHVAVRGCDGAELVAGFDLEGVAVSSTAACSSGRSEPSESLLRLFPEAPWRASSALRVSLGPSTTDGDVTRFIEVAPTVISRLRGAHSSTKRT